MRTTLLIAPGGQIMTLGDAHLQELGLTGEVTRKRASSVVPVNRFKRAGFLGLRCLFGERGRVAEWTRTWTGPWTGRILATGETFTAQSRRVVLKWEQARVEEILCQGS